MFTHFIFDIDGTLVDTEKTGLLSLGQTVEALTGRRMTLEELYPYFGIPSYEASKMLSVGDPVRFAELWEENFQKAISLSRIFDGIPQVLDEMVRSGRVMGVVTSRSRLEYDNDRLLLKWKPYFNPVICSEDSATHKPEPGPALAFLEKSGAKASECLYIGDTMHDCSCAQGAGVAFALADWNGKGAQKIPAEYHLTRPEQILEFI